MGGKVAEEMTFGPENVTSGASSDIQQITKIARAMVTQFGFTKELGHVDYANEQTSYLGMYGGGSNHSSMTQKIIDEKVKEIIDEGYETAKRILTEQSKDLENLALGLLEYETLTGPEIVKVISGKPLNRDDDDDGLAEVKSSVVSIPRAKKPKIKGDNTLDPELST